MNYFKRFKSQQKGSSLLTVLVVLLVLSLLAVASFDSSNLQSLMTRNSQLRLEVFNVGKSEIDTQMGTFSSVSSGTIHPTIQTLIDTPGDTAVAATTSGTATLGFTKQIDLSRNGLCQLAGDDLSSSSSGVCNYFILTATTTVDNLNLSSTQSQAFSVTTLSVQ